MRLLPSFAIASTAVLAAAHPAFAGKPSPPVPLANPGEWLTENDYPKSALEKEHEGNTGFLLTVGADGRVSDCKVTIGSGWEVLDEAACRIVSERARFSPALDKRGRAIAGTYANRIRWVIPKEQRLPKDGLAVTTITVTPDGKISDCRVVTADGDAATQMTVGPLTTCPTVTLPHGYVDANGKPVAKLLRYSYRIEVLDLPVGNPAPTPVPPPKTSN